MYSVKDRENEHEMEMVGIIVTQSPFRVELHL